MSTYVNITGNPDDISAAGARLKGEAEAFKAQAQTVLSGITAIDGAAPWGSDEAGRQFEQQYNQAPDGGTPFSQSLKDAMSQAGEQLSKAGDGIIMAMTGYQGTDESNKGDIAGVKH